MDWKISPRLAAMTTVTKQLYIDTDCGACCTVFVLTSEPGCLWPHF